VVRLNITVEGSTEEGFVKQVLAPYLGERGVFAVARSVISGEGLSPYNGSSDYEFRGGLRDYDRPRKDIIDWMSEDSGEDVRFTTMFDFYALPKQWPGWIAVDERPPVETYVGQIEEAFATDIEDRRFLPYIQVHEFEALVLSEPSAILGPHPEAQDAVSELDTVVTACGGPELVNDGHETHPSRRIKELIPAYRKTVSGVAVTHAIGIDRMRAKCPHFDEWVGKLVDLGE
jgi:hypothetical protein